MRIWLIIGALNGALAVALGAIGAHGLGPSAVEAQRAMFETAVHYHFFHALALLAVAALAPRLEGPVARRALAFAGLAFTLGIMLFCGGLYLLSGLGLALGGRLAPFGGTLFIVGWLSLAIAGAAPRR